MSTFSSLALVAVLGLATAGTVPAPDHPGWVKTGVPSQMESVKVVVSVQKQNLDTLFDFVSKVSTPGSPEYKNYLTADEANAMTAPRTEDVESVVAWLSAVGSPTVSNGVVTVETVVAKAEQLFNTDFHMMAEIEGERTTTRAGEYTIPSHIAPAVAGVFGLHGLPLPRKAVQERSNVGAPPAVTPKVLADTYGIKGVKPAGDAKNRMAVAEFQGQFMNKSDLEVFFKMYLPDSPASDAEVYAFHGGSQNGEGIEAQLDIQFIMGVAPGVKAEFWEQSNMDFCADLKNWTGLLLAASDIPFVHSISYGWQGNLTQIGCTQAEVMDVDADFAKLAARGISIIFASGDSGSGYAPPQPPQPAQCSHTAPGMAGTKYTGDVLRTLKIGVPPSDPSEGAWICCTIAGEVGAGSGYAGFSYIQDACKPNEQCEGTCTVLKTINGTEKAPGYTSGKSKPTPPAPPPAAVALWPSWPASSPFVTSVGATRFYQDSVTGGVEAAVSEEDHFGSGGGFSPWTFLEQGKWQATAVTHYFKTVPASTLPSGGYDRAGRATPDVSALGTGYAVINGGVPLPGGVGGTSASAPVFSGMVALVNDALLQAGKKQLGLLNPFIYMNEQAFTDVTIGSDKVGRGGGSLPEGFNCTTGWDPVTGMGTPIFAKLLAAALKA
eukprot:m.156566 g.156566  ORF g.156566 m.156566 type:complete len:663 (+) comp31005_c0_seq1:164-2152(+)